MKRLLRLNSLLLKLNGGPGSGNPNPGQGRGKGKPAGGGSSKQERMRQVLKKLFDVQEELDNNPDKTKIKELKSLEEKYTKEAKRIEKEIEDEKSQKLKDKFSIKEKSLTEIQDTFENLRQQANWTKDEVAVAGVYFGGTSYDEIQDYLRGGDDFTLSNGHKASEAVEVLKKKIDASSLPEDLTLYRALAIRNDRIQRVESNQFSSPVFQSTSLNEMNAMQVVMGYMADEVFAEFHEIALLKIHAKKGSKGIASYTSGEYEVVLPQNSTFKIKNKKNMLSHIEYEVDYE